MNEAPGVALWGQITLASIAVMVLLYAWSGAPLQAVTGALVFAVACYAYRRRTR